MTNNDTPNIKAIRYAKQNITVDPSPVARMNWIRDNAPEVAAYLDGRTDMLLRRSAAEYPRTYMQQFSRLVNGR